LVSSFRQTGPDSHQPFSLLREEGLLGFLNVRSPHFSLSAGGRLLFFPFGWFFKPFFFLFPLSNRPGYEGTTFPSTKWL